MPKRQLASCVCTGTGECLLSRALHLLMALACLQGSSSSTSQADADADAGTAAMTLTCWSRNLSCAGHTPGNIPLPLHSLVTQLATLAQGNTVLLPVHKLSPPFHL
jgi:hypothetical protein